ncbi:MAG: DUF6232 family protein [Dehalococcoidia bacterium]
MTPNDDSNEERVFYSDANGIRIGSRNVEFGEYKYATRNVEAAYVVRQKMLRWPAFLIIAIGVGLFGYGFVSGDPIWFVVGMAGLVSGVINLSRKKRDHGVRLITAKGPVMVFATPEKAYAEKVLFSMRQAIEATSGTRSAPTG